MFADSQGVRGWNVVSTAAAYVWRVMVYRRDCAAQTLGNLSRGQTGRQQREHFFCVWGRDQPSRQQDAAGNRSRAAAALGGCIDCRVVAVSRDNFGGQAHGYIIHFLYLH